MEELRRGASAFVTDEGGSATIEFAIWLPFFVVILMFVADLTMIMFHRSDVERIVQDANRLRSIGVLSTNEETRSYLIARLMLPDGTMRGTAEAGLISMYATSIVRIQLSQVDMFGVVPRLFGDMELIVVNQQILENMEV